MNSSKYRRSSNKENQNLVLSVNQCKRLTYKIWWSHFESVIVTLDLSTQNGKLYLLTWITIVDQMFPCKLITNNVKSFFYHTGCMQNIEHYLSWHEFHQDGRVVKALDLSSNGRMSAWVRTPLLVALCWGRQSGSVCSYVSDAPWLPTRACCAIKPRTDNWAQAKSSVQFPRQWTIKTRAGFDGALFQFGKQSILT